MKKLLSISFALLILLSGMHFTISTHYCGGKFSAAKVSVSGEVATCGMENEANKCPLPDKKIGSHCCDNKISALIVDHNFAPSFTGFQVFSPNILHVFITLSNATNYSLTAINLSSTDVSPPLNILVSAVCLPKICVFRI